jgi:hypothetical protein
VEAGDSVAGVVAGGFGGTVAGAPAGAVGDSLAGAGVAAPLAGLAAGGAGIVRLCFCWSGITNAPFWPQARIVPVRQISTASCAIFMMSSIPGR